MHYVIAVLWFLGGVVRVYRQARFFQIEEYQNGRYWRWLLTHPERWAWRRPLVAWSVALLLSFLFMETQNALLLLIVYAATAVIAVWPEREAEVKKAFVPTQRALRLLIASVLALGVLTLAAVLLVDAVAMPSVPLSYFVFTAGAGLALFLLSPLLLIVGNVLTIPVEAAVRQGYLRQARGVLRRLDPTVIGITGSYGKTSTKHYLAHLLSGRYTAISTPKSYNTLMGVTLAINTQLKNAREIDYFIVEMGAYVEGEIAQICRLTRPQLSIVTAVGPQHLERFGSLEAVANAKFEIVAALPPDGAAILNGDDPNVAAMADKAPVDHIVRVSRDGADGAGLVAENIEETLDGLRFDVRDTATGEQRRFQAPVYGLHNVTNILLAAAAARYIGLPLGEIAMRVAALAPFEHRLQRSVQPGGLVVLDDAYSANPVGAVSALRVLGMHKDGRRILVTPGMVELGELQDEENRKLGALAVDYATDIVLVGVEQTQPIYDGVTGTAFDPAHLHVFDSHAEAVAWLRENAAAGDTVLFLNDLPDTYL